MFDTLDDSNFALYAAKYYYNPSGLGEQEFEDDLSRIRYIKRLLARYNENGELNERLVLNHTIVLYNVFYHTACTRMLVFKLRNYLSSLKPFLVYLSYWTDDIEPIGLDKEKIIGSNIFLDPYVVKKLRKL
jgi:hypothetical protein